MSDRYRLRFTPNAQRQIAEWLVGSRLRQWREERVLQLHYLLKSAPLSCGEGRETDFRRVLPLGELVVRYVVTESVRDVLVLDVQVVGPNR